MKDKEFSSCVTLRAIVIALLILAGTGVASAPKETVLHMFRGDSDGLAPYGRLISDAAGNLYGTTALGGTSGAGTVFELTAPAPWTESILYNFTGANDGSQPYGGLISDSAGNFYGTTFQGGTFNGGTVYELMPPSGKGGTWTETVLYSFAGGADGAGPQSDLNFDQAGNLYGTTTGGGAPGNGIVFELTPPAAQGGTWTESILHSFVVSEGTSPRAAVIFDKKGALYGTLANDGQFGAGAVFRLWPPNAKGDPWVEETLYTFGGGDDGYGPLSRLILYGGDLYGTTVLGGGGADSGTVFQLTPPISQHGPWTETVLHSFNCKSKKHLDGCYPWAGLTMGKKGTFYGTTQYGGQWPVGGTVFELTKSGGVWTESVLFSFSTRLNQVADAGLLRSDTGILYGTTIGYTQKAGMVFELQP